MTQLNPMGAPGQALSWIESLPAAMQHHRVRSLSTYAQAVYALLFMRANASGHVDPGEALNATRQLIRGADALRELHESGLITADSYDVGLWVNLPTLLDQADAFAKGEVP